MSSVWDKSKTFYFKNFDVVVAKARADDPVRFYAEVHRKDGAYYASYGSNQRLPILVAYEVKRKVEHDK